MKYQCLENDFIITQDTPINIKDLCDEHRGIGADGLIIISNNNILFFNKDGTKAKFCGNGIRCAAKYIHDYIDSQKKDFLFENINYTISNNSNLYTLKFNICNYNKIKSYYLVNSGVYHLIVFNKPTSKKAKKLFNKYNCNITFYFNNCAKTYEKGVGFTKGCGSGLISIMSILNKEFNINNKIIYSDENKSTLFVENNYIYLESEVFYVYEGEIKC